MCEPGFKTEIATNFNKSWLIQVWINFSQSDGVAANTDNVEDETKPIDSVGLVTSRAQGNVAVVQDQVNQANPGTSSKMAAWVDRKSAAPIYFKIFRLQYIRFLINPPLWQALSFKA